MGWLDLALKLAVAGAAIAVTAIVVHKITKAIIAKKAKEKFRNAVKALVKSKSTKKVNVGIFDNQENHLGDIPFEGDEVASDIRVGDVIYCY